MTAFARPNRLARLTDLSALPPLEARLVAYLRNQADGVAGHGDVAADLCHHLGPARGARVFQLWCELCEVFDRFGHRRLDIAPPDCHAVTPDEAGFARFVAIAAEARREDAMYAALMMLRADLAPIATSLATQVGLALKQCQLIAEHAPARTTHKGGSGLH